MFKKWIIKWLELDTRPVAAHRISGKITRIQIADQATEARMKEEVARRVREEVDRRMRPSGGLIG